MTQAARFSTKDAAAAVATKFPLAGAVYLPPFVAKVEGVLPGWYVGFPRNVRQSLVTTNELAL